MADSNSTRRHPSFQDLTGKQFGKWTVLGRDYNHPSKNIYWTCLCECGTEKSVQGHALADSRSHSCNRCSKRQHGMYGTPEYAVWAGMNKRCNNPNSQFFHRYGGNGIAVCERWKSFENFYADMGTKPSPSHSIDRIDGLKGYEPENCRWATKREQSRNRPSFVRYVTFNGETLCLTDWAVKIGISVSGLYGRLRKGMSIEQALTAPVRQRRQE